MMGRTPSIDSIAKQGILFHRSLYGQPSYTAGARRSITGQLPVRTGMTTVGNPRLGPRHQEGASTLAEVLKPWGYNTAQFGENDLGDRNGFRRRRTASTGVVRQPLPSQCRGGAGRARLSGP